MQLNESVVDIAHMPEGKVFAALADGSVAVLQVLCTLPSQSSYHGFKIAFSISGSSFGVENTMLHLYSTIRLALQGRMFARPACSLNMFLYEVSALRKFTYILI